MKILAMYASINAHGNDAKGAFIPQALGFAKERRIKGDYVHCVPFDNAIADRGKRREAFLEIIAQAVPFDAFVYFGHGLRTGLPSAGFTMKTIDSLAEAISKKAAKNVIVTLYACSTAAAPDNDRNKLDGDGGFADELRDRLSLLGHTGWLDAHTVAGHTTINRMDRRFYLDGKARGTGGAWLVAPGSPEWQAWGKALRGDPAFRFGFPYMTSAQVHAALTAP